MSTLTKVAVTALLSVAAFAACGQTKPKAQHKPVDQHERTFTVDSAEELKYEQEAKQKAAHEKALWDALRTRVVSDKEMAEILETGPRIIPYQDGGGVHCWVCGGAGCCDPSNYDAVDNGRRIEAAIIFNNALLNQFKMRSCAKEGGK